MKKQHFILAKVFVQVVIAIIAITAASGLYALDIAPMTWATHAVTGKSYQEPNRSDWINILDYGADPTGATDSAPAIQAALNVLNNRDSTLMGRTVYFPAGTYTIKSTLHLTGAYYNVIGCGLNTTIKWAGPAGGAMLWQDGAGENCRFVGFVWDGGGTSGNTTTGASCAYEEFSSTGSYMTAIRHENESFRNFYATGTYLTDSNYPHGFPPAAIISGFATLGQPVGEVTIFNCCFKSCATAIYNSVDIVNNFMWVIDGCEFENNGVGFNGGMGACYILMNSHFQHSSTYDITNTAGGIRGQRLTSSGSGQFFKGPTGGTAFSDCWVDGWTNPAIAALELDASGEASVTDCTFTNPPAGATGAICSGGGTGEQIDLLLSNNIAPNFPSGFGMIHEIGGIIPTVDWVPAGSMGGNITSPTETFLQSAAINDSTNIIDVTQSPYNLSPGDGLASPNPGLNNDCTAGIQAAINAARTANNGSIVYIPGGLYKITSTLTASGGNYAIEGEGIFTQLCWAGGSNGTMMAVSSPQHITVRQLNLAAANNLPSNPAGDYNSSYPVSDCTTITGLEETATGASNAVYDNILYTSFVYGNPFSPGAFDPDGPGLALSNLPAGSTVYIPVLNSPLTVTDCGPAQIYSKMAYIGGVFVSGATHPKTGFLGLMVAEGGQENASLANFNVTDNQNLLVGPYYSEEGANDVSLLRGAGTTPGRVTIQGLSSAPYHPSVSINVNNYAGRLFYGQGLVEGGQVDPAPAVQVQQTGTNPIDLMLVDNLFIGSAPTITLGSGANLIATLNENTDTGFMTDTPDPLTDANLTSLASAMDDFRQLGALNLAVEYGQVNPSGLVAYWKLDETASPSADSSMTGATGTWVNGPTFTTDHPGLIPYADAGSVTFNGSNQYIDMGNPAFLPSGTGARTLCGWARSNSTAAGWRIFASFGTNAGGEMMFIGMNGTAIGAGGSVTDLTGSGNFWDNNWHFVALTYDGTTAKLYGDGVLLASAPETWNLVHGDCTIGDHLGGEFFWNGSVDDVRVYNYALSAAQVANLIAPASGQVINVQFTDGGDLPVLNGQAWSTTVSPLAYAGTTWTQTYNYGNITGTNLPYSDGSASTVGFTLTGVSQLATNNQWAALPMYYETEWSTGNMTLTITGLQNGQTYDIYIPVAFNNGDGSAVTIGTQTLQTTGLESPTFASGVNYVKFTGITPVSNSIVITLAPNGTGQNFSTLSGFQIVAH